MAPEEAANDVEPPVDEVETPLTPERFSDLASAETLTEYDGTILAYLGRGPRVSDGHAGDWLILLREGGSLFRSASKADSRERWLAIPLSEARRKQAIGDHISLLETIGFAEWRPYRLLGADPFHPDSVERLQVRSVPHSYFPSAVVSVHGKSIDGLTPSPEASRSKLTIHLVPGKREVRHPSLWDIGSVQHALELFVESTRAYLRLRTLGAADIETFMAPPEAEPHTIGDLDWARFGALGARLGTVLLELEMGTVELGETPAIRRCFPELAPISVDASSRTFAGTTPGTPGGRSAVALLSLGGLLEAVGVAFLLSWSGDVGLERVMVSPLSAHEGARNLSRAARDEFASAAIRAPLVRVVLTEDEAAPLRRTADRQAGGFESLLADIREQIPPTGAQVELSLRPDQVERVVRYVQSYGAGGAQDRLRPIYLQLRRLGPSFGLLR